MLSGVGMRGIITGKDVLRTLLACCLFFSLAQVHAADWELARDRLGITVETRLIEGEPIKEYRGRMNVKARLSSIVALMDDNKKAPLWMYDNELLLMDEYVSTQDRWYYLVNSAPWPLRSRDAYIRVVSSQDPVTKIIEFDITTYPQRKIANKKMVRIQSLRGGWRFEPKADKTVDVTYSMWVDPGGRIPKALANMVVVENPFNSLKGMLRMLATGDYDDAVVDWIVEP